MRLILVILLSLTIFKAQAINVTLSGDVDGQMFSKLINATGTDKEYNIIIMSLGGRVDIGFYIISFLRARQAEGYTINCTARGYVMSMAATILQACDNRYSDSTTVFMQHPSKPNEWLSRQFDSLRFTLTASRLKITLSDFIENYVLPEKRFKAKEALKIGIVDRIL